MATLQNSSYYKIVSLGVETYDLSVLDFNNNLFSEVTINVDTTGGAVTIELPEINTLPNFGVIIKVVRTAGANNVVVTASGSDKIGSATTVTLNAINKSVEVSPIESINWYGVITA
jgi:hypothetical protein